MVVKAIITRSKNLEQYAYRIDTKTIFEKTFKGSIKL